MERARGAGADLEPLLQEVLRRAQDDWPTLKLPPALFFRHVSERLPKEEDPVQALAALHAGDLYLACACARGDARAVRYFDERFLPLVADYIAKLESSASAADEVRQAVRVRLLVGQHGAAPLIAQYRGAGPLGAWLRVVSVRAVQDLFRARKRQSRGGAANTQPAAPADPELAYLKRRYAPHFEQAFQVVLAALPAKQKNLLSFYFLDGMSTDAIGALFAVNGSTVRRWLARLRQDIINETYRRLAEGLGARPTEIDSLLQLVRSELDVSICRCLKSSPSQ